jgi:hypothetical protein
MAVLDSDRHRQYARFAMHCLSRDTANSDPDHRMIQREMAIEWLRLAEGTLHPSPNQS